MNEYPKLPDEPKPADAPLPKFSASWIAPKRRVEGWDGVTAAIADFAAPAHFDYLRLVPENDDLYSGTAAVYKIWRVGANHFRLEEKREIPLSPEEAVKTRFVARAVKLHGRANVRVHAAKKSGWRFHGGDKTYSKVHVVFADVSFDCMKRWAERLCLQWSALHRLTHKKDWGGDPAIWDVQVTSPSPFNPAVFNPDNTGIGDRDYEDIFAMTTEQAGPFQWSLLQNVSGSGKAPEGPEGAPPSSFYYDLLLPFLEQLGAS
jgi:hypothetical protein